MPIKYDVVVIGGGPAGMASALSAYKNGSTVLIIERNGKLGGILNQCIHNGFGLHYFEEELTGPEYALRFARMVKDSGVDVWLNSFVTAVDTKARCLTVVNPKGEFVVCAGAIIMAMGCRERVASNVGITGERPVGVYTAGQVQQMINIKGKMPCTRAVILGSGDIGLIMARRLTLQGCKVVCVLEASSTSSGLRRNISQCLNDFDIPLMLNTTVKNVLGYPRICGVQTAKTDNAFNLVKGSEKTIKCDALILSVGLVPEVELISGLDISKKTRGAIVDEFRQTNLSGVFSCGNVLQVHDLVDNVSHESEIAGKYASMFAKGTLKYGKKRVDVIAGEGVSYTSPSYCYAPDVKVGGLSINNLDKIDIYFRLNGTIAKSWLVAMCGDKVVAKKFVIGAHAGEMQDLQIERGKICDDIVVCIREKL